MNMNILSVVTPPSIYQCHRSDLIVDDGGDITLLIHEGKKVEDLFLGDGTIPDSSSMDNFEFKIFQTIIKRQLEGGETDK